MDESRDSALFTPFLAGSKRRKRTAKFLRLSILFSCFHFFRVVIFPFSENKRRLLRTGFSAAEVSRTDGSEAVQTLIYSTNANICWPCTLALGSPFTSLLQLLIIWIVTVQRSSDPFKTSTPPRRPAGPFCLQFTTVGSSGADINIIIK